MKHLIIILTLCIALPSLSIAASIEPEKMLESIKQEEEEQQKQPSRAARQGSRIAWLARRAGGDKDDRPR